MRSLWFIAGSFALILGAIGIVLPLLPTVPFLLLTALCFAKSSDKAHQWLLNHPTFGPPIRDWENNGAIRKSAKRIATLCIAFAFILALIMGVPAWALTAQAIVLCCVLTFIWTRPEA